MSLRWEFRECGEGDVPADLRSDADGGWYSSTRHHEDYSVQHFYAGGPDGMPRDDSGRYKLTVDIRTGERKYFRAVCVETKDIREESEEDRGRYRAYLTHRVIDEDTPERLEFWEWQVAEVTVCAAGLEGEDPLAEGTSWRSEAEARSMIETVLTVLFAFDHAEMIRERTEAK